MRRTSANAAGFSSGAATNRVADVKLNPGSELRKLNAEGAMSGMVEERTRDSSESDLKILLASDKVAGLVVYPSGNIIILYSFLAFRQWSSLVPIFIRLMSPLRLQVWAI